MKYYKGACCTCMVLITGNIVFEFLENLKKGPFKMMNNETQENELFYVLPQSTPIHLREPWQRGKNIKFILDRKGVTIKSSSIDY